MVGVEVSPVAPKYTGCPVAFEGDVRDKNPRQRRTRRWIGASRHRSQRLLPSGRRFRRAMLRWRPLSVRRTAAHAPGSCCMLTALLTDGPRDEMPWQRFRAGVRRRSIAEPRWRWICWRQISNEAGAEAKNWREAAGDRPSCPVLPPAQV